MQFFPIRSTIDGHTFQSIDFPLIDSEGSSGEATLTVNDVAPFPIVHASQSWLDLFRFSKEEIVGRSLRVVNGPNTDTAVLQSIIQSTLEGKQSTAAITLYSSAGHESVMVVKAFKQFGCCTLTMTSSDAIRHPQLHTEYKARMLVTANEPYFVQQVSAGFSKAFGLCQQEIVGRTIRMLDGPHTDILGFQQLLTKTTTGISQRGTMVAFTKDCVELMCEVELIPVLGRCGSITSLQIEFTPQATTNSSAANHNAFRSQFEEYWQAEEATSSLRKTNAGPHWGAPDAFTQLPAVQIVGGTNFAGQPLAQPAMQPHLPAHHPVQAASCPPFAVSQLAPAHQPSHPVSSHGSTTVQGRPPLAAQGQRRAMVEEAGGASRSGSTMSISDSSSQHASAPASESDCPGRGEAAGRAGGRASLRLFPRRKAGESDVKALGGPVDLSKELVDEFVGMSMKEAAQKLGISASAMKKACRKLGVKRWPHKSTRAAADVMTYNSAYVRRLYSKYAAKPDDAAGHHGPAGQPERESDISEGSEGAASDSSPCQTPRTNDLNPAVPFQGSGPSGLPVDGRQHVPHPSVVWENSEAASPAESACQWPGQVPPGLSVSQLEGTGMPVAEQGQRHSAFPRPGQGHLGAGPLSGGLGHRF